MVTHEKRQKLLVGVDEAGYGPNLGPFVIGGSAWIVPEELDEAIFINLLDQEQFQCRSFSTGCSHVPIGDSKKLYRSGDTLQSLEIGLLSLVESLGNSASSVAQLVDLLCGNGVFPSQPPWYSDLGSLPVPFDEQLKPEIKRLSQQASQRLDKHGIRLVAVSSRVVAEPEFNRQVEKLGSKGLLLSRATFELISKLLSSAPELPAEIFCDRQGGRTNYLPLLMDWKPDDWFIELERTKLRCSYRSSGDSSYTIHFTIGGDNFAPTALASMAAKY
ncbi:MAG: hypothetical protein U0930_26225 [Pirellulales bacterium]